MVREPERAAMAKRAGVSADDLAELVARLDERAHETFGRFARLAEESPAGELLSALLLPLARSAAPATAAAVATESADAVAEESAATAVAVGTPEPEPAAAPERAAPPEPAAAPEPAVPEAAPAPEPAVVLEPPIPVPAAPPHTVDPSAQPWSSDAAGLSIYPPIVIGAEPWARTPPAPKDDE